MREITVVVWGDSIAAGGWPQEAEQTYNVSLNTGVPIRVINEAVCGKPAAKAKDEFTERVERHLPNIVIIHFGANDLRHDGSRETLPLSTPDEFAAYLTAMVSACQRVAGARVLLLGYHRFRRPVTMPTGLTLDETRRRYNAIIHDVAMRAGVMYLDMEHAIDSVPDTPWTACVCDDGVHLSPLGQQLYANLLATAIAGIARALTVETKQ